MLRAAAFCEICCILRNHRWTGCVEEDEERRVVHFQAAQGDDGMIVAPHLPESNADATRREWLTESERDVDLC